MIEVEIERSGISEVVKWSDANIRHLDPLINSFNYGHKNHDSPPFPIDPVINGRIALWEGDIFSLCPDGLTQMTNENLSEFPPGLRDRTEGTEYETEISTEIQSLRTGDSKLVKSHPNLPCRHVILTVGPKYVEKYKTAAETALFTCYNGVLERCDERKLSSVAIPPLHLAGATMPNSAKFPDELGISIGLRTIRRYLEKGHIYPPLIILVIPNSHLLKLYESLMLCYFPRESSHELYSTCRLPPNIGDSEGGGYWAERRIRIYPNPPNTRGEIGESDEGSGENLEREELMSEEFRIMRKDVDIERSNFMAHIKL